MSSGDELERLEKAADAVNEQNHWTDSESEYSPSESSSEDDNAAVIPHRSGKSPRANSSRKFRQGGTPDDNVERPHNDFDDHPQGPPAMAPSYTTEDDNVLNAADWDELKYEQKFLAKTHRANLEDLISKLENENDDGDVVDLQTGRIVRDIGHLNALQPQSHFKLESDSEDEVEETEESEETIIYSVLQRPLTLLRSALDA